MPETAVFQLAFLTVEMVFVAGVILALFRFRRLLSLLPLAAFVGSNQYLQTVLSSTHYIDLGGDLLISPGSVVLFPSTFFAVLLIYLHDGVSKARALIIGIVISNSTLMVLSVLTALQIEGEGVVNLLAMPVEVFHVDARIFVCGTVILILDAVLIVMLYEFLFARFRWLPLVARLPLALFLVMGFDALAFVALGFWGQPLFAEILRAQLITKSLAGVVYGLLLYGSVRWLASKEGLGRRETTTGVFSIFTYRERYVRVRQEKEELTETLEELSRAQRRILESEQRFRDLLDHSRELVQVVALDGAFLLVNNAWREALGYDSQEISRLRAMDILHESSRELCEQAFENCKTGNSTGIFEAKLVAKDGRILLVEGDLGCRFEEGEPVATRCIFRDITENRAVERLKDQLLATVSHELRTPVSSIQGSLEVLVDGKMGPFSEDAAHVLEVARRNSRRLGRLVDDILDLHTLEAGSMGLELHPTDISELIRQAVEEDRGFSDRFEVAVVVEPAAPMVASVDQFWLKQVMSNLISNAVKHSPPGGEVTVRMEQDLETIRVSVNDGGLGIPVEFRDRVFEPFSQARGHRLEGRQQEKVAGTGLGLAIAKAVVERMRGTMGFETEEGLGTRFYFDLPLSGASSEAQ